MIDDAAPAVATRWFVVSAVILAGVVSAFQAGKAPVSLPDLRAALGLSLVGAGWVVSMFNVLGAVAGALVGAFGDQIGHRRAVLGGLLLTGCAGLGGALAPDAATLLVTRLFEGLGFITTVTAAPGLIVAASRRADQRLAFGFWSGYMPGGASLMMMLSPLILGAVGWRGLWLVNGVVMLAAAVLVGAATRHLPRLRPGRRRGAGAILGDIARTARSPGPPVLALAFAAYTLQYLALIAFLPTLLVEGDGMSEGRAALLTALANGANLIGTSTCGVLLHRGMPRWIVIAAGYLVMGLASLLIFSPGLPFALRYAAVIAFTCISGTIPSACLGGAPVHAPEPRLVGTTTGLIMQGSNLGQTIGPPALAALAAAVGGWTWSPVIFLAAASAGLVLALVLRRLERRR